MAAPGCSKAKAFCEAETEEEAPAPTQDTSSSNQEAVQDYDFVEEPDQDYFCPVSLELLLEPCQTTCCGQHISQQAANRLARDGKPCPMCKYEIYSFQQDKYFKRKVRQLKVHCPYKKSGCEWVGELGDLEHHSTSCPKRPWKCQHCNFESTYDTGTNTHTPKCAKYPLPCPNQCEIGTVLRCDAEKHQLVCPLQFVECELVYAGCDMKVPRRDLAKHMTENAQQHLMSATLLNLRLTKELHKKMEEKDQEVIKLKKQLKCAEEDKAQLQRKIDTLSNFTSVELTLTEFKLCQAKQGSGPWLSDPFYFKGYKFLLNIDTNGSGEAKGTHLTAYIYSLPGEQDKQLKWPVRILVHLEMLNQQGDHSHYVQLANRKIKEAPKGSTPHRIGDSLKYYPLDKLGYDDTNNTEYLKDDKIQFRVFMKVCK